MFNRHVATNNSMPTGKIDRDFLVWLDISPSVENASMLHLARWIAPPINWAKQNCDGTSKGNPRHSGGGGIRRNSSGDLMFVFGSYYELKSSCWAEAKAVLNRVQYARSKAITLLWLELDSLLLVHMLRGKCVVPWNVSYIFRAINNL